MRTVRRFYFYLVALISLEVVVWGAISLARTIFENLPGGTSQIATGLSLVLVGLPIFLLHWIVVQRDSQKDEEERTSRLRSIFLYAVRLATLIPVVMGILAILSRPLLTLVGKSASLAMVGANQTVWDNLVAIVINLVAWVYFERVLRIDWAANLADSPLPEVRRLYRYIWVIYSLVLAITGIELIFWFVFYWPQGLNAVENGWLGNGLAWVLVGAPLWLYTWRTVQSSLDQAGERTSNLRLSVIYLLALTGVVTTLSAAGMVLAYALRWMLGESQTLLEFFSDHNGSLATSITFVIIWVYFGRQLAVEIDLEPDTFRRAGLRRLYGYILGLLGNATTFFGVWWLLGAVVDILLGNLAGFQVVRNEVSIAIALLAVGLPVWLRNWPRMQLEAVQLTEPGDHARRSLVRKGYLYLALFLTVVGTMVSAGALFFLVLNSALGNPISDFWLTFFQRLQTLLLVGLWLVYHLQVLRGDARMAQQALGAQHASFPVLLIETDSRNFSEELLQRLTRQMPRLPVKTVRMDSDALVSSLAEARLVVLPLELAINPPEALRLWMEENPQDQGGKDARVKYLVAPLPVEGWVWLGLPQRSPREMAQVAAQAVRQVAEGQAVKAPGSTSPWVITGYVLAALFGLQLFFILFGLVMSIMGGGF